MSKTVGITRQRAWRRRGFPRRALFLLVVPVATLLVAKLCVAKPQTDSQSLVEGESTLQSRLLAPCCWTQTLDVHESDTARGLRAEIHRRMSAGEKASAIENDLAGRHGERIRAVPQGRSLTTLGLWLSALVALAGTGVASMLVRWARRGRQQGEGCEVKKADSGVAQTVPRDEWDDRLDSEIDQLPQ